jgi:hypothetical protein
MRSFLLAVVATATFASIPATAFAQDAAWPALTDSHENADRPPRPESSEPRLRFDVAGGFTAGVASSARVAAFAFVPTLVVDLGDQFGDEWALYGHAGVGTALFFNQAEAYLIGEWTPRRWISVGTGLGVDAMSLFGFCDCQGVRKDWSGASLPLLVGFNFGQPDPQQARRAALRLAFEGAGGVEPATGTIGVHGGLSLGGAWM